MRRPSISFWLKSHCCHTRSYCCIVQGLNWKYIYSNCQWRVREKFHFLQMTAWSESLSRCIIVWKTCLHVLYNLNLYWLCVIETKPKFSAQGRLFTSSGHVKYLYVSWLQTTILRTNKDKPNDSVCNTALTYRYMYICGIFCDLTKRHAIF